MKKTKILLLAILGVCMLSFIPTALGTAEHRPISAFTDTNRNIAAWSDPNNNLTIFPHGFWLFGVDGLESIAECDHHGSVLVRELKDGEILYKVNIHVEGASMFVANETTLIFVGEMEYHFQATLIVYDGDISDPVPNLLQMWFPLYFPGGPEGRPTFSHLTGKGTGTFVDDYAAIRHGFDPGATAKVTVNQVGLLREEGEKWPIDFVFIH